MSCAFSTISERRSSPNCSWICGQFLADDLGDARRVGQDVEQVGNLRHDLLVLADDLVRLQVGQALQLHFQNALRLDFGQVIAVGVQAELGRHVHRARELGVDARQHFLDHRRLPGAAEQTLFRDRPGFPSVLISSTISSTLASATARPSRIWPRSRALRSSNTVRRVTTSRRWRRKASSISLQVQQARLAVDQRHHVHAEGVLHLRLLVQIVQDHVGVLAALQFDVRRACPTCRIRRACRQCRRSAFRAPARRS